MKTGSLSLWGGRSTKPWGCSRPPWAKHLEEKLRCFFAKTKFGGPEVLKALITARGTKGQPPEDLVARLGTAGIPHPAERRDVIWINSSRPSGAGNGNNGQVCLELAHDFPGKAHEAWMGGKRTGNW